MSPPCPPGRRERDRRRQTTETAGPRPARRRDPGLTGADVRDLSARAGVGPASVVIRRARRHAIAGDSAWQQRLARYERGEVVIAELTVVAVIEHLGDQRPHTLACCHETVWLDRQTTWPVIEERLRQIARRDFQTIADGLRDQHGVTPRGQVAVDIQLDADLARLLAPRPSGDRGVVGDA